MKMKLFSLWVAMAVSGSLLAANAEDTVYENVYNQVISGTHLNTSSSGPGYFRITGNSTVILSNLTIHADTNAGKIVRDGGGSRIGGGLIEICDNANVTIYLEGDNEIRAVGSGEYCGAGIYVQDGSSLTIKNRNDRQPGKLIVRGGRWGAAIGGYCRGSGSITIEGGIINAEATEQAAAIGAGDGLTYRASYGKITITGGEIYAKAGTLSAAIGGGYQCRGGTVEISGGKITAVASSDCGTAIGPGSGEVGTYVNTVTGGQISCPNGSIYPAPVNKQGEQYQFGVTVDGADVGRLAGKGWSYDLKDHYLTLDSACDHVVSGANTNGEVMVELDGDVTATLENLTLKSTVDGECCLWVTGTRNGATVLLKGTNTLEGTNGEGIAINDEATLTIDRACGTTDENAVLEATGAEKYPAIAVGYRDERSETGVGAVYIRGGHVIAHGGRAAAAIGNGLNKFYGGGLKICIAGGFVEAYGGDDAAAIGGGYDSLVGDVHITGGTVKASRGKRVATFDSRQAVDISCGFHRDPSVDTLFTGGSIYCVNLEDDGQLRPNPKNAAADQVWQVAVTNLSAGAAEVAGLAGYGTADLRTIEGSLYLWLPNGVYRFTVNGENYLATVAGANTVAEPCGPPEPVATVTVPAVEHVASVTVTTNGVAVAPLASGTYVVLQGADVVVVCAAEEGYGFTGGGETETAQTTKTFEFRDVQADVAIAPGDLATYHIPVVRGITVNGENIGNWSGQRGDWDYVEAGESRLTLNRAADYLIEFTGTNNALDTLAGASATRLWLAPAANPGGSAGTLAATLALGEIDCPAAEVVIGGGTLTRLTGADIAALTVIGGSFVLPADFPVAPSNGQARVWRVDVACAGESPAVDGLGAYGLEGVAPVDGWLHLWLPDGFYDFTVDGVRMRATVAGADTVAEKYVEPFAKAVYDVANRTLSFLYDDRDYEPEAGALCVWTNMTEAGWTSEDEPGRGALAATNVVVDASFAAYRPESTRRWFANMGAIEKLDLTALDLSAATNACEMFAAATNLETIYVSDRVSLTNCLTAAAGLFNSCAALVGERGTAFAGVTPDSTNHWRYAQVDGEDFYGTGSAAGFFSRRRAPVTLTVPEELPTNTVAVAVYENDFPVGATGGVYTTSAGFAMRVVYTAAEGYQFPDGDSSYAFDYPALTEDTAVDIAALPPRQVKPARPIGVLAGAVLTLYFDNLNHADGDAVYVDSTWGGWIPDDITGAADSPIHEVAIDPGFAAARLTTTKNLFFGLANVTNVVGLENFDTSLAANMDYMFCGMGKVRTLVVGDRFVTGSVTSSTNMFSGCTNLVGQCGTTLENCALADPDARLACVDFGAERPGLFTALVPFEASVRRGAEEIAFYHTLAEAMSNVTAGAEVKLLSARAEPVAFAAGTDFVFDANGMAAAGLTATVRAGVTLTLRNAPDGATAELAATDARLAFAGAVPGEDVFLSVSYPERRLGDLVVTNAWGVLPQSDKVRICQAGYAAFPTAAGFALEAAWSRPFALVEETPGSTNFTAFATAAEALGASETAAATLALLSYRNDALPFATNLVVAPLAVAAGRSVALTTALRHSPDGTNTSWSVAAPPETATLRGAVTVEGTLELRNAWIDGAITIGTNALVRIAEDFALTNGYVYLTLAEGATSSVVRVASDCWTPAELKAHCRVTNPGWTFAPEAGGLVVKKVGDYVARVGETYYESVSEAIAAAPDKGTVWFLSYTNAVTGTHSDTVEAQTGAIAIPAEKTVVIKSARRTTFDSGSGSDYSWNYDAPETPTTLDMGGVALDLGLDARLVLSNLNVTGTISLTGKGLIDARGYTGSPIRVFLGDKAEASICRAIAIGKASQFELVDSLGNLSDRDDFVFWDVDVFKWDYRQIGNGKVELWINDGGAIKKPTAESKTGIFTYSYERDAGKGTEELEGYLVYLDYDALKVRLPPVKTEYLRTDESWKRIADGDTFPRDWKIDSDGCLTFRFEGTARKIAGIVSKPMTPEEIYDEAERRIKEEAEEKKKREEKIGGLIGAIAGGAACAGVIGGVAAFIAAGGGGGAAALPAVAGIAAMAGVAGALNAGDVIGPQNPQEIEHHEWQHDDQPHNPQEEVDPEPHVDPSEIDEWIENFKKLWDAISRYMDVNDAIEATLKIFEALFMPLEYKSYPYFASSFQTVHGYAADDNDAKYNIHWFFSTTIHSSLMPTNGEVDITAKYSFKGFDDEEGFDEKSAFGKITDCMSTIEKMIKLLEKICAEQNLASGEIETYTKIAKFFREILDILQARGYFDPPANASVVLPDGAKYNVASMEFGQGSHIPNTPRTAPIFELESGSRLRLEDSCSMRGYKFNTPKGLIHVSAGAELILDDFTLESNTSVSGSSPIVVDKGGKVIVTGKTSLSGIDCAKADLSIATGDRRDVKSVAGNLAGEIWIDGRLRVGDAISTNRLDNSTGWNKIHSRRYNRWVEPYVNGSKVVWAYRSGIGEVTPLFHPPFSIEITNMVYGVESNQYAHLTGTITNAVFGLYYQLRDSAEVGGKYAPIDGAEKWAEQSGDLEIDFLVPAEYDKRFFNIGVELEPLE